MIAALIPLVQGHFLFTFR